MQKLRGSARRPVEWPGELAGAETAHAVGLVLLDFTQLVGGDEDQRLVRRAHGVIEPQCLPGRRMLGVALGQVDGVLSGAEGERHLVLADRLGGVGDLALAAGVELDQEVVADGR